jgi:ribosome-binding protein aMBF1 (putative translation factor)
MVTFSELANRLKMDVHQLMREVNAKAPPSKALVKGLARELGIHRIVPGEAGG